jgi:hypothetical protein
LDQGGTPGGGTVTKTQTVRLVGLNFWNAPPLPKIAGRDRILIIRLLEAEEDQINAGAKAAGKSKSEWVRDVLMEAARVK